MTIFETMTLPIVRLPDLPWIPFHWIIKSLVDILGFHKAIQLRTVNRKLQVLNSHGQLLTVSDAFNQEILDILVSRFMQALGLLGTINPSPGLGFPRFPQTSNLFLGRLIGHGLQQGRLENTSLVLRIKSIASVLHDLKASSTPLSPQLIEQSVCQALLTRGNPQTVLKAIFQDTDLCPPLPSPEEILSDATCVAAEIGDVKLLEYFAKTGVDINVETESKLFRRPLISASKWGHEQACRFLLNNGADANVVDPLRLEKRRQDAKYKPPAPRRPIYYDALGAACWHGHLSIVRLFFEPAYRLIFTSDDDDVLVLTARRGHAEILSFLLQKADFSLHENLLGSRILHSAARAGSTAILKMMIDAGIDINYMEQYRQIRALQNAASLGREEAVKYLLERGASLEYRSPFASALGLAAQRGYMGTLKTLIEYGANINEPRFRSEVPLIPAAGASQVEAVQYLLDHGLDLSLEDCGARALEEAANMGYDEVVRMLIAAGVDVNLDERRLKSARYGQPLLTAKIHGQTSTVKVLLGLGAKDIDPLSSRYRDEFLTGKLPYSPQPSPLLRP